MVATFNIMQCRDVRLLYEVAEKIVDMYKDQWPIDWDIHRQSFRSDVSCGGWIQTARLQLVIRQGGFSDPTERGQRKWHEEVLIPIVQILCEDLGSNAQVSYNVGEISVNVFGEGK